MFTQIDTVVVGGGQAGLVTSYLLTQEGRDHIILEKSDRPAHAWELGRWDSFTLVTPNWSITLPGAEYKGESPKEFMGRDEIVAMFRNYVEKYQLPIRYNTRVCSIQHAANGVDFLVATETDVFLAKNVVVATGLFQRPRFPQCAAKFPDHIAQFHSGEYRNPNQLPEGAVLVVGSSQSGCQIADELQKSGRQVYLCVGQSGRAPRAYRGKDSSEWLDLLGLSDVTVDKLPSPKVKYAGNPHVSGKVGAQNINLHQFVRNGMTVLGRLDDVNNNQLSIAPTLHQGLKFADDFETNYTKAIDNYILQHGLNQPEEALAKLDDGYHVPQVESLDLASAGITTVIWAVGYTFDFNIVNFPIFDEDGYPVHSRGVTEIPGLFFIGLPWLYKQRSGLLSGVGDDARYILAQIKSRNTKKNHTLQDLELADA